MSEATMTLVAHIILAVLSGVSVVLSAVLSRRVRVIHKAVNGRYHALESRVKHLEHPNDGAD